ncbi:MAG TPA: ABC transporter permease [Tepidisphaeraceae bacterium]|jgi:ribose/xylose/arabinose/galactoside ABC-type transport system permease subunit
MAELSAENLAHPKPRWRLPRMQEAGLVGVIVLMGLILTVFGKPVTVRGEQVNNFFRMSNLLGGVATPMAPIAIMALGATFVIISGGIDISVGSIFALAALGGAAALQRFPEDASAFKSISLGLLVPSAIGLACGMLNGLLVTSLRMHPFIVTLGTMSIFRGLCNVTLPAGVKTLPYTGRVLPDSFTRDFMMYYARPLLQPIPMLLMLACVAGAWFYLMLMVAGRETYAVGGNEEAARFSGIRVGLVKLRVYALAGLLAGIAGAVSVGYFGTASANTGTGYELTVIAAAVVGGASLSGGRGTALGALLGALVIQLIEDGIPILNFDPEYKTIIIGASIIIAVAIDRMSEQLRTRRLAGRRLLQ